MSRNLTKSLPTVIFQKSNKIRTCKWDANLNFKYWILALAIAISPKPTWVVVLWFYRTNLAINFHNRPLFVSYVFQEIYEISSSMTGNIPVSIIYIVSLFPEWNEKFPRRLWNRKDAKCLSKTLKSFNFCFYYICLTMVLDIQSIYIPQDQKFFCNLDNRSLIVHGGVYHLFPH